MKTVQLFIATLFFAVSTMASNLNITNVAGTSASVSFTVTWNYSWNVAGVANSPNNWDAAWVFVKYASCTSGVPSWQHLVMSSADVHTISGGVLEVDPVTDGVGVFIRRTSIGNGTVSANATLFFATALPSANYQFKVLGIEMVYCPANSFQIGDGYTSGAFNPITINASMQAAGIATANTTLGGTGTIAGTLPSTYPMGVNGFYCMKYEIQTADMIEFLNTLTYDQQAADITSNAPNSPVGTAVVTLGSSYQSVNISVQGSATTLPVKTPAVFTLGSVATPGSINWTNKAYLAFLDWVGLRPMTEMEFEKTCRGTLDRVPGEFPWGSSVTGGGTALSGSSNRYQSGATYYGVLDIGGWYDFAWQGLIVNTSDQSATGTGGSAFTGALGDGTITSNGLSDVANWPNPTSALGSGLRGRANNGLMVAVSARPLPATTNKVNCGDRGVRQYP